MIERSLQFPASLSDRLRSRGGSCDICRKAFLAGGWAIDAGALLEGAGLLLPVPIVGVLITGPLDNAIGALLTALGATAPLDQLGCLLVGFVLAARMRAQVNHQRDLLLSRIQLGCALEKRVELIIGQVSQHLLRMTLITPSQQRSCCCAPLSLRWSRRSLSLARSFGQSSLLS